MSLSITFEVLERITRKGAEGTDWVKKRNRRIKGDTLDRLVDNARDYALLRWTNGPVEVEAVKLDGYIIIGTATVRVTVLHPEH